MTTPIQPTQSKSKGPRKPIAYEADKPLEYNSVDWFDTDYTNDFSEDDRKLPYYNREHNKEYSIFSFGVTLAGHSVCCQVKNYYPYFYVLIPNEYDEKQVKDMLYAFNPDNTEEIEAPSGGDEGGYIDDRAKFYSMYYKSAIVNDQITVVEREIFWKFMNRAKFRFIKLVFRSKAAMTFYYRQLQRPIDLRITGKYKQPVKYNMFEADLEPILRFFHDRGLKPSGWVRLAVGEYSKASNLSKCQINVATSWNRFQPADIDALAPVRVAAFDIEADSSHGDFPVARKDCQKLANQLVITWLRDKHTLEKEDKHSDKAQAAHTRLEEGDDFFAKRIRKAVGLPQFQTVDDEVDTIFLKGCFATESYENNMKRKCYGDGFKALCREIHHICSRNIRKVKADTKMKIAVNIVKDKETAHIDSNGYIELDTLIDIARSVARRFGKDIENPEDLVDKIITKEVMVRFVNQKLNAYFGRAYGDKCIQIGTVFWEYGDSECFHNNIITLRGADSFNVGDRHCEIISFGGDSSKWTESGAEVEEAKVLLEWTRLIDEYDPDIIVGYNIHGFDMSYMYDRAVDIIAKLTKGNIGKEEQRELAKHARFQKFLNMGRLHPDMVAKCDGARGGLVNKKLSSSALGDNFLFYFNTPGRVQIDLLKVCQSSMAKLPSYKLDDVASYYISGDIKSFYPINPTDTEAYKMKVTNLAEIEAGNYVVITMATTGQQLYDGDKIMVHAIDRESGTLTLARPVPVNCIKNLPQWGLAKDDVSAKDIFRLQKGTDADRGIIAKYCIQDCVLLVRLLKKLEVITNNFGMSNVCLIPFSYIFLRGQGIKIFSLVVNECAQNGYLLPTLEKVEVDDEETEVSDSVRHRAAAASAALTLGDDDTVPIMGVTSGSAAGAGDGEDEGQDTSTEAGSEFTLKNDFNVIKMTEDGYEGAIVLTPKPNIYFEPITVLDFASLYPSEMIASDLSHDRIVEDECWLGDEGKARLDALGYDILDRSYDNLVWVDSKNHGKGKKPEGQTHVRFVQPKTGEKGLIPRILQKLLGARKASKKKMEAETDPFKKTLYEGLQLAYKLTANSLYGQIGARTSKIYKKEIAASTTAGGRANIYTGRDFCIKNNPGCEVVYGDSIPGDELVLIRISDKWGNLNVRYETIESVAYSYFGFLEYEVVGKEHYVPTNKALHLAVYTDLGWTPIVYLMRHRTNKQLLRVHIKNGSAVTVTADHSLILADGSEIKPTELKLGDKLLTHSMFSHYKDTLAMLTERGFSREQVDTFNDQDGDIVTQIEDLGYTFDYVYDLETENHHFAAGKGNIVVHNTDSVFVKLNLVREDGTYPQTIPEKIQRSIDIGMWLQQKMKDEKVFKKPHDLEYEKVFCPLILITKKRYIGIKYEEDPNKGKKTSMGVVTKRRDNAPILKHTFNGVVDTLTQDCDLEKAVNYVKDVCRDMVDDKFDLNMFVISKTLREYYKDPESIAHKVLAMRMGERDPGNKPASNERIPYVYIKIDEKPGIEYLQGDRIEHINYVREHSSQVDYQVYIMNQLMKPISQILELVVEHLPGYPYRNDPDYFTNLENMYFNKYGGDLKKTAKKVSQVKQDLVQKLVFQPLIDYAIRKVNKVTTLDKWFVSQTPADTTTTDTGASAKPAGPKIDIAAIAVKKGTKAESGTSIVKKSKQQSLDKFFGKPAN